MPATIDGDAILTRIRAILEDNVGTLRVIDADRFNGGLWDDLDDDEKSKRATFCPITEANIVSTLPHPGRCSVLTNVGLYAIEVLIKVVRHVGPEHMAKDDIRDDVKGLAANDGNVIADAMEWPGNLDRATTGIVSGQLQYQGSTFSMSLPSDNSGPGTITTEHVLSGSVETAPA